MSRQLRAAAANRLRTCRIPSRSPPTRREGRAVRRGRRHSRSWRTNAASSCRSPTSPIDEIYRVPAMLAPFQGEEAIEMPTSTGKRREMRRAGQLKFSVKGQTLSLTAFVEPTIVRWRACSCRSPIRPTAAETYTAGRYLDLDAHGDRALRSRFQSRLSPVLLLQRRVRLSGPAAGESPRSFRSGRASA